MDLYIFPESKTLLMARVVSTGPLFALVAQPAVVQPGAIWLAKVTGNPVLPFHLEAASHWTAPSWDSSQVPLPFSRVAVVVGEPLFVPHDADAAALEAKRVELEAILAGLEERALNLLAV